MKRSICLIFLGLFIVLNGESQITKIKDYSQREAAEIGVNKGVTFKEAGYSGLFYIPRTNGKEFWTNSDRGVNMDCGNANLPGCRPTYDKMYAFPGYTPKLHHIILEGDSIRVIKTITIKRPNGTGATGVLNPTGLGSTAAELPSFDTVQDCANFLSKTAAKDTFGIDAEGIQIDRQGNFWLCEEGGASIWKLNKDGVLIKRYTPYANLGGAQSVDVLLDTVFKYRKNNRGFEGITITPNGKVYAIIQSPVLYPTQSIGESTRVHRIIEIDPTTNQQRMFVYLNDGIIGSSGANQIRLRDWKIGDMAAVNDSTILVLEAAARGNTDIKRLYQININQATAVHSGLYGAQTLEALADSAGLAAFNIKAVNKTLVMDLLANGWPSTYDKAEGLTIIDDSTIAICNDNDFGASSPGNDGLPVASSLLSHVVTFQLSGANKLQQVQLPWIAELKVFYGINNISETDSVYQTSKGNCFGKTRVMQNVSRKFVLRNTGTDTLILSNMVWKDTTGNPFKVTNAPTLPIKIAAGDSFLLDVSYKPITTDTIRKMLQIESNDRGSSTFNLWITGSGVTPEIAVTGNGNNITTGQTATAIVNGTDAGMVGVGKWMKKRFLIKNTGTDTLFISGASFSGASSGVYSIDTAVKLPAFIKLNDSMWLPYIMKPLDTGVKTATLTIQNTDIDESNFQFAMKFLAIAPSINVTANKVVINNGSNVLNSNNNTDFGMYKSDIPMVRMYKITNEGLDTLVIKEIKSSNTDFIVEGINVWPVVLTAGMSQTYNIRWTKSAGQTSESTIQVVNNDATKTNYTYKVGGAVSSALKRNNTSEVWYYNESNQHLVIKGVQLNQINGKVLVFDVTGNLLEEYPVKNNEQGTLEIPIEKLYSGVYFFSIIDGNEMIYSNRLVIQNGY